MRSRDVKVAPWTDGQISKRKDGALSPGRQCPRLWARPLSCLFWLTSLLAPQEAWHGASLTESQGWLRTGHLAHGNKDRLLPPLHPPCPPSPCVTASRGTCANTWPVEGVAVPCDPDAVPACSVPISYWNEGCWWDNAITIMIRMQERQERGLENDKCNILIILKLWHLMIIILLFMYSYLCLLCISMY